jgi:uncharacterized protein YecE (DUF72 family)
VRLRLGLAAWSNSHFDNALYHPGTKHEQYLPRYASLLDCAEADVLHHTYPKKDTLLEWVAQTPEGFTFLPKMHKNATHEGQVDVAQRWLLGLEPLRDAGRLGPVLLQFPPSLKRETGWDLVERLLRTAGAGTFAVEVRHTSWFTDAFRELLENHEAPLVWSTHPKAFAPPWATGEKGFVRFTGTIGAQRGRYVTVADRTPDIKEVAKRLQQASWKECFCIATNPFEGNAVDTLPKVAAAFGLDDLAKRMKREPGLPLLADAPVEKGARQSKLL